MLAVYTGAVAECTAMLAVCTGVFAVCTGVVAVCTGVVAACTGVAAVYTARTKAIVGAGEICISVVFYVLVTTAVIFAIIGGLFSMRG
jgi:hypothetical protein